MTLQILWRMLFLASRTDKVLFLSVWGDSFNYIRCGPNFLFYRFSRFFKSFSLRLNIWRFSLQHRQFAHGRCRQIFGTLLVELINQKNHLFIKFQEKLEKWVEKFNLKSKAFPFWWTFSTFQKECPRSYEKSEFYSSSNARTQFKKMLLVSDRLFCENVFF